ncbi:transposase family protein [Streptomyces flaveolus]|uniref:transposase family protein n=1 Tax=Streptomyces flaveolus TaxID=67297 RepID=UPI00342C2A23
MCRQSVTVCLVKSPARQHCVTGPLADRLARLADPRCRRGKRHPFVAVVLIACCAVVTGAGSFVATGATDAPQDVLTRLGARTATALAVRIPSRGTTIRRVIKDTCPGGLADLLGQAATRPAPAPSRSTARAPVARAWAAPRPPICWPR